MLQRSKRSGWLAYSLLLWLASAAQAGQDSLFETLGCAGCHYEDGGIPLFPPYDHGFLIEMLTWPPAGMPAVDPASVDTEALLEAVNAWPDATGQADSGEARQQPAPAGDSRD